ncbi:glutamate synthase-related protein, partial [Klebsiella variicola]|uniref:glutamate synthase-related protein n=1 Tax=Klebsiella variicola TaxID=244366 RepID=UPI00272F42DC
GILPKHKVTQEIAETRGIMMGEDCISPSRHSAFSTPIEMMQFIQQLRELSGGKPVGLPGTYRVGIWRNTGDFNDVYRDLNGQPIGLTGNAPDQH